MIEIEDLVIFWMCLGTLWCSFIPLFKSKDVINSGQLRWANGKWYQKYMRIVIYDHIYQNRYNVHVGIFMICTGSIILLVY